MMYLTDRYRPEVLSNIKAICCIHNDSKSYISKGTASDSSITPISIMALDTIRLENSRALLEVCVIPDQHYL